MGRLWPPKGHQIISITSNAGFCCCWGVLFGGSGRFPLGRSVRGQRLSAAPTWKENIAFAKAQSSVVVVFSVFFFLFCCRIEEKDSSKLFFVLAGPVLYPRQVIRRSPVAVASCLDWPELLFKVCGVLSSTYPEPLWEPCLTWGFGAFSMGFLAIHKQPVGSQPVRLKCRIWSVRNDCAQELHRCRRLSSLLAESTNGFRWLVLCTVHASHRRAGFPGSRAWRQ